MIARVVLLASLAMVVTASGEEPDWEIQMRLGGSNLSTGNYNEAKRHYRMAWDAANELPAAGDKQALAANYLGVATESMGEYREAERWYRESLSFAERAVSADHAGLAILQSNLANTYRMQGKLAKAEDICRRAFDLLAGDLHPPDYALAHALGTLGAIASARGNFDEAERALSQAARLAQKLPEDPTSLQAQVLNNLALLYRQQGKRELALTTFSQAYSVIRSHSGEGHPELFHPLKNIAILQAAAGDTAAALSSIESAIRIGENGLGPNHPAIGSALELHADLLRRCKRTKEARALTARAMAIRRLNQTNDLSRYTLDVRDRKQLSR